MTHLAADVLDRTFDSSPLIDLLRVCVILLTALAMTLAWRVVIVGRRPYDTRMMWAMTVYWIFAVLQELQQVGKPFVWWRLPLLAVAAVLALSSVFRRISE